MSALSFSPLCRPLIPSTSPNVSPSLSRPRSSSQVQVNPLGEKRGSLWAWGCWGRPLPLGGQPVPQCMGLFPGPTKSYFIFKCYNQASDPQGALYGCGSRSQGQDGDLIAQAEVKSGGANWFRGWMSNEKAFFLSCHVNFNPYSIWGSRHTRDLPLWLSSGL